MTIRPVLTGDAMANRDLLQCHLDTREPIELELAAGRWPLAGGLVLHAGQSLCGTPETTLVRTKLDEAPFMHVIGSGVVLRDLKFDLPATNPGLHEGDRRTGITIGDYLYPDPATWIEDVAVANVRIAWTARCTANSVAVMGAVRHATLKQLEIVGGGTGVAVHWGAVGRSVSDIVGPSYHPHHLAIDGLKVRAAFESFYLSSVHDVTVRRVVAEDVEIGFRLLPGDNGVRFQENPAESLVSSNISVSDCDIAWHGLYGIRIAGWGRSEVDHEVTRLPYRGSSVSDCRLRVTGAESRKSSVVVENATGVTLSRIDVGELPESVSALKVDGVDADRRELLSASAQPEIACRFRRRDSRTCD